MISMNSLYGQIHRNINNLVPLFKNKIPSLEMSVKYYDHWLQNLISPVCFILKGSIAQQIKNE